MQLNINEDLMTAIRKEDQDLIRSSVQQGADVEYVDHLDQTPLMNAIDIGNADIVKLLLELGADVNSDKGNLLPLQLEIDAAVQQANNDPDTKEDSLVIIKLLLAHGADILKRHSKNGKNAYEFARNYHGRAQRLFEKLLGNIPPQQA